MAGAVGHELLDDERHTLERPIGSGRRIVVEIGDRVQPPVQHAQIGERAVQQLLGAELPGPDELGGAERVQFVEHQLRQRSRLVATNASSFNSG